MHYPHRSTLRAGEQVQVLVDPHDPRYAELPGAPSATTSRWVGPLVIAIIATLGLAFLGLAVIRQLRHQRARRAAPPAAVRQR